MGTSIELGKLILVSVIYQRWKSFNIALRIFLTTLTVCLMFVTSLGVYGLLSSGYEKGSSELSGRENTIQLYQLKESKFKDDINRINLQVQYQNNRVNQLISVRGEQEKRLNVIYSDSLRRGASSNEKIINKADQTIDEANDHISKYTDKISQYNDSILKVDQKINELKNTKNSIDLMAIKYLARTTGKSMDNVVSWFIFILIFVLDPSAIGLLMVYNQMILDKNKQEKPPEEKKDSTFKKIFKKREKKSENNFGNQKENTYINDTNELPEIATEELTAESPAEIAEEIKQEIQNVEQLINKEIHSISMPDGGIRSI
jgi:hypothetical protein